MMLVSSSSRSVSSSSRVGGTGGRRRTTVPSCVGRSNGSINNSKRPEESSDGDSVNFKEPKSVRVAKRTLKASVASFVKAVSDIAGERARLEEDRRATLRALKTTLRDAASREAESVHEVLAALSDSLRRCCAVAPSTVVVEADAINEDDDDSSDDSDSDDDKPKSPATAVVDV